MLPSAPVRIASPLTPRSQALPLESDRNLPWKQDRGTVKFWAIFFAHFSQLVQLILFECRAQNDIVQKHKTDGVIVKLPSPFNSGRLSQR